MRSRAASTPVTVRPTGPNLPCEFRENELRHVSMRHRLSQEPGTMAVRLVGEMAMVNKEHEGRSLKLVGGATDKKHAAARKYCAELIAGHSRFCNGAERSLRPGMLAQWKPGMKNRRTPDYGVPMMVVELLEPPIIDTTFESGSVYFRERLDIILGFLDEDDEFCMLHYDSRRFEPYTGVGLKTNAAQGAG